GRTPAHRARIIYENFLPEVRRRAAHRGSAREFVIYQIDAATIGRVAVERVPLAINDFIRDACIAASGGRAVVVRPGSAKVCQRQVGKIKMPRRVHASFGITAAGAGGVFAFKSGGGDDPFESLTAVEGMPHPT